VVNGPVGSLRRGPKPRHGVALTAPEYRTLKHLARLRTAPHAEVVRAKILLLAYEHPDVEQRRHCQRGGLHRSDRAQMASAEPGPIVTSRFLFGGRHRLIRAALTAVLLVVGTGCVAAYRPEPIDRVSFLARRQVKSEQGVTVTVAVPTDDESERLFGVPMAGEGIQPVWLRIENHGEQPYWFAPAELDPNYFTPLEAANRCRSLFIPAQEMRQHFLARAIGSYVAPGHHIGGFVFTNLDRGVTVLSPLSSAASS
jgi:hypothetical protein